MEYNTSQSPLIIREYGRNVQRLVDYCQTLKNETERNKVARYIIELMGQVNPHLKNVEEFRHKLWDHLFEISDFSLKVESPYPIPKKGSLHTRPKPLKYPKSKIKHRHYGKNVETMVSKAIDLKDKDKQAGFSQCIGNYMKLVYKNWNKENVNDDQIRGDLELLSGGILKIESGANLDTLAKGHSNISSEARPQFRKGGKHQNRGKQPFKKGKFQKRNRY